MGESANWGESAAIDFISVNPHHLLKSTGKLLPGFCRSNYPITKLLNCQIFLALSAILSICHSECCRSACDGERETPRMFASVNAVSGNFLENAFVFLCDSAML